MGLNRFKSFVSIPFMVFAFAFLALGREVPIPPGFVSIASEGNLRLHFSPDSFHLAVEDTRTGKVWESNPPFRDEDIPNDYWGDRMRSVFVLSYWDDERKRVESVPSSSPAFGRWSEPIEGGVKVWYELSPPQADIRFSLEYRLEGDSLVVRMPAEDTFETGKFRLLSIELLPFFGASSDDIPGYALIPDGPGAILRFDKNHPEFINNFSEMIYGDDLISSGMEFRNSRIAMPVFGLVAEDSAFLGIVTAGDFYAKINYSPAGYIVDYHRASAEFLFRTVFKDFYRKDKIMASYDKTDREVRYIFLAGADANYVGMAKAYRDHLIRTRGATKLPDVESVPLNLRLFCGIEEKSFLFNRFVRMTSFSEAREILRALRERGVERVDLTLIGWNRKGYGGLYPTRLPPERRLGGVRGLKDLIRYGKENGVRIFLEDNYLDSFKRSRDFSSVDVVRDEKRLAIGGSVGFLGGFGRYGRFQLTSATRSSEDGHYYLSPEAAYRKFALRDIPKIKEYGINGGLEFQHFGEGVFNSYNDKYPSSRRETAKFWLKIVSLAHEIWGRATVRGGNTYTIGLVDRIVDPPMEGSNPFPGSETIPFYQISLHGLVEYAGRTANLRMGSRSIFLRDVEYGALPTFELTYSRTEKLRDTRYRDLFSSYYKDWLEDAVREYKEVNLKMGYLRNQFIVDHRKLAPNVYQTTYEDGSKVIVNYGGDEFKGDGFTVGGLNYILIGGERDEDR
ncbi:MAG: DUF5696 domain-containing protein [bacterium]